MIGQAVCHLESVEGRVAEAVRILDKCRSREMSREVACNSAYVGPFRLLQAKLIKVVLHAFRMKIG